MGLFNSILFGVHNGMKEAGKNRTARDWQYKELETTPFLYSSGYLEELHEDARERWQEDAIQDHMDRHKVLGKGYKYDDIGKRK